MLQALRHSVMVKVFGLIALTVLLCFPLAEIDSLNRERGRSQQEAAQELAETYAGPQTVVGPLLVVPYVERWMEPLRDAKGALIGQEARSRRAAQIVYPDKLHTEGTLAPQERYRGIFKIPFYRLNATLDGAFPAFDAARVARSETGSKIEIGEPYVALSVSDLRGLDGSPTLALGGEALRFAQRLPGIADDAALANGIHAPLAGAALAAWQAGKPLPFEMKLGLVGQETLSMAPIAEDTTAHLTSPWAHPSFGGRFLAAERSVSAEGFDARWRVSSLVTTARDQVRAGLLAGSSGGREGARNARTGFDTVEVTAATAMAASASAAAASGAAMMGPLQTFDVSLAQPLNVYSMSTRAAKYGVLFIGLVLMAAYMFELFRKLRLHPVQYGLVGLSIALFFLLLLALSEKFAFHLAYAGAAGASVLLLAVYFSAVLGHWKRGAAFGGYVAVLYGALYGLLASESNALLLGALLIFGMLSLLMLATRKVDWYGLSAGSATGTTAGVTAGAPA
ncbi:MAG: cell envelope integrity protein CreD [Variovorax sp.]|nr:MAG: cell envelope integrity protein CreD [Variovorax sp.]